MVMRVTICQVFPHLSGPPILTDLPILAKSQKALKGTILPVQRYSLVGLGY